MHCRRTLLQSSMLMWRSFAPVPFFKTPQHGRRAPRPNRNTNSLLPKQDSITRKIWTELELRFEPIVIQKNILRLPMAILIERRSKPIYERPAPPTKRELARSFSWRAQIQIPRFRRSNVGYQ